MKKFIILMLSILAFGLILLPQSAEAEMSALTEDQMEGYLLNTWNFPLTLKVDIDLESESDDLLPDAEELKLRTHFLESPTPFDEEGDEQHVEVFKKYIEATGHTTVEIFLRFKPEPIGVEK
jgi:hypothetical protein